MGSKAQAWADMEAGEPDTWQILGSSRGHVLGGQRSRQGRNPSDHGRGVRAVPVKSLQDLRGALVAETEAPQAGRAHNVPPGAMHDLNWDFLSLTLTLEPWLAPASLVVSPGPP